MVETDRDVACDLDVLALIVADRHLVGVVQQDVGGLQRGIREQTGRDELALPLRGLVLELRHPAELAEGDVALHDPAELAVLAHVALREHGGDVGVEPDGEQHRGELHRRVTDHAGLLGDRERMQVDDAVECVAFVLSATQFAARRGSCRGGRRRSAACRTAPASHRRCSCRSRRPDAIRCPRALSGRIRSRRWSMCNARLRGAVRSAAAVDPERTGRPLRDRPRADRRRVSGRDREDAGRLDLDVTTEFLLIAATLVELKARRLLPDQSDMDLDEEFALWEERDLLLARLLECKTFKDVARSSTRSPTKPTCPSHARLAPTNASPTDARPARGNEPATPPECRHPGAHPTARADRRPVPRQPDQVHRRRRRRRADRRVAAGRPDLVSAGSPPISPIGSRSSCDSWRCSSCSSRASSRLDQPERFGDIDVAWAADEDVDPTPS